MLPFVRDLQLVLEEGLYIPYSKYVGVQPDLDLRMVFTILASFPRDLSVGSLADTGGGFASSNLRRRRNRFLCRFHPVFCFPVYLLALGVLISVPDERGEELGPVFVS
jgi:hypothetical protein